MLNTKICPLRQNRYGRNAMINADSLTLTGENNDLAVKCIFQDIYGTEKNDSITINQFSADMLLKLKHAASSYSYPGSDKH